MSDPALLADCETFARELAGVLQATVAPTANITVRVLGDRVAAATDPQQIGLTTNRRTVAWLSVSMKIGWDHEGRYLAVDESQFAVGAAGVSEPFIRVEFVRSRRYAQAHINFHAESSALGYLRGLAGKPGIPKVQELHLPVGSRRFRPSLEDVIEFLIEDLGIDAKLEWQAAIADGRARWAERQLGAAVRDEPTIAARVLTEAGWTVAPPVGH